MDTREEGWRVRDKVFSNQMLPLLTKTAEGMDFKPFYATKRYQKTVDWTILDFGKEFWFGRTRILEKQMVEPNHTDRNHDLHPPKLTWIPKMTVWKRWTPSKYEST